jgi:hypothetical protein
MALATRTSGPRHCLIGRRDAFLDKGGPNYNLVRLLVASVAQLAEQLTLNQLVEGSSPSRGTTLTTTQVSIDGSRMTDQRLLK